MRAGALCPGGFRAWPLPGYWSADQTIPVQKVCRQPKAEGRCTGWDVAAGRAGCGPEYRVGSYLCESCATGTYAKDDGSCAACPSDSMTPWARYGGLIQLLAGGA